MGLLKKASVWLSPLVNSVLIMVWFSIEWTKDKFNSLVK